MRKKSVLGFFTVIGLFILLLSQCTGTIENRSVPHNEANGVAGKIGKTGDAIPNGTRKSVKIAVSLDGQSYSVLQRLSSQYAAAHDGVTFQLENLPSKEAYQTLKQESQMGEAPDLMLLDNCWVNEFAALGYLLPVDELFTSEQQEQRIPQTLAQVKWNGYLWGIPSTVDPYILVWNKKTAADNKWDHPPESPEELLQWNKALSHPAEGKYGIYLDPDDPFAFIAASFALTGVWADFSEPSRKWNDPGTGKVLEAFLNPQGQAWSTKPFAQNDPLTTPSWDPWEQLGLGKLAGIITTFSEFHLHPHGNLAIAALPHTFGDANGRSVWLRGSSFVISSRSENVQAAIDWIKDMTSLDASAAIWAGGKLLPALVTVWNTPAMRADDFYHSYEWLINNGMTLPAHPETVQVLQALQREEQRLRNGEEEVKGFAEQMGKQGLNALHM